tara:strand:+ start:35077 stop:35526 length:450 start_codon:yes stop_codon:yes gene_type:complete
MNIIFNKKFLHALEAVLDISIYSASTPARAKEITKRQGIPTRYLEKILQELVHKNILKGTRGPNGGYTLGKEKRNIFLIEIYNAIMETEKNKNKNINTRIRIEVINPLIKNISNEAINSLKKTTVYDLFKKLHKNKINTNKENKTDFTI